MKILFCQRNLLMQYDMEDALNRLGIEYRCASYVFSNTDTDDRFCEHLRYFLKEDNYDAVFGFNFIPIIADVCHELSIPYISWTYDAGWEFSRRDALFYDTNYIFHFDGKACEEYKKSGFRHIYHMPLAVNCKRLDAHIENSKGNTDYASDITFLGSLYEKYRNSPPGFFNVLDPKDREFLLSLIASESKIYTTHSLWNNIDEAYTQQVNANSTVPIALTRIALLTACSSCIAGKQRLEMVTRLADAFGITLYCQSLVDVPKNVDYRWRATYYSQMPLIFNRSTINLNLTIPSIETGMPLRILDVLGAGGFLITNHQLEIDEHFKIGHDIEVFHDLDELNDKVSYYLKHPDIVADIAHNGHEIVSSKFSFEQKFLEMLHIVGLKP